MNKLAELPNVGKVLEKNLAIIGVQTPEELRAMGSKEAFFRIRAKADPGACLHMLYGLEGAVQGVPDTRLPAQAKADLKEYFKSL